jgi:hypothetical protein
MMNVELLINGYGWRLVTLFKNEGVSMDKIATHIDMSSEGLRKSLRNESLSLRNFVLICRYFNWSFDEMVQKLIHQDYFDYWTKVQKKDGSEYVKMVREGNEPMPN